MHGDALFLKVYWISLLAYPTLLWAVQYFFSELPDLPDLTLRHVSPRVRWLALYLHLTIAFMPLVNVILLCVTVFLVARSIYRKYTVREEDDESGPFPPMH